MSHLHRYKCLYINAGYELFFYSMYFIYFFNEINLMRVKGRKAFKQLRRFQTTTKTCMSLLLVYFASGYSCLKLSLKPQNWV